MFVRISPTCLYSRLLGSNRLGVVLEDVFWITLKIGGLVLCTFALCLRFADLVKRAISWYDLDTKCSQS